MTFHQSHQKDKDSGTDNVQLENYVRMHLPTRNFAGVLSSDQLPEYDDLPIDGCLIANYSPHDEAGTHWVAMIHLKNTSRPPEYFDSFGFPPDGLDEVLNVKSHMMPYIQMCSKRAGFHGQYRYSKLNLQCPDGDVCGEFACYCIIKQCLPQDKVTGKILPQWNRVPLDNDCHRIDFFVKRFINIRK